MSAISAVLAVGGHAADMEFTAGALIAKYTRAGARAVLLHATPGEMGHPPVLANRARTASVGEARATTQAAGGAMWRYLVPPTPVRCLPWAV